MDWTTETKLRQELSEARALVDAYKADAKRYQWLRTQHWSDSQIAVVCNPKDAIKIGHYVPSGDLLDKAIDDLMNKTHNAEVSR